MSMTLERLPARAFRILKSVKARTGAPLFYGIIACLLIWLWIHVTFSTTEPTDVPGWPIDTLRWEEDALVNSINSTLGFQKIIAISRGTQWRLRGLDAAARETSLDITIPPQSYVTDGQIRRLQSKGSADGTVKPSPGAAKAWLAHMKILETIIDEGYHTALIIEDDVDWAVEIKQQMALVAEKVRQFTNAPSSDPDLYGTSWDVLWLGHCGEWYAADENPKVLSWPDSTAGKREDWRGIYEIKWLEGLPGGQRHLLRSRSPICTYAYAVNIYGARKLLKWASQGNGEAYDIHLSNGCGSGVLDCLTVVDQLFHHYRPALGFGASSDVATHEQSGTGSADEKFETDVGSTAVILRSARCQSLFGKTCQDKSYNYERPFHST